ncbi:MAG: oligosaccharide flippase family protein [Calditrichaeota bacterium]|nr:oligosaccharide flippase family protein [Calditrichota bacterium]
MKAHAQRHGTTERGWLPAVHSLYGDILLSTGGRVGAAALTFAKTVLLVRLLHPAVYGGVAVLLSWGYIASALGELGCGAAFLVLESGAQREQQHARFWSFLRGRVVVSLVLGCAWFAATMVGLMPRSGVGGVALLFGLGQNICHAPEFLFQTKRRFGSYSRFLIAVALLQLLWTAGALGLYQRWQLSQQSLWVLLALAPWFAALVTLVPLAFLDRSLLHPQPSADWAYLKRMIAFGKWVALGGLLMYVYQRWAVIALARGGSAEAAGAYDVAVTCAQVVNLVTLSAVSALSPRFASSHDPTVVRRGLLRLFTRGGPVVVGVLAVYYLVRGPVISMVFGPSYNASTVALDALMPSFLLTLLTEPMVAYTTFGLKAPHVVFWAALFRTAALMLGAGAAVQYHGVAGLAILQSALRIGEHLFITFFALSGRRSS